MGVGAEILYIDESYGYNVWGDKCFVIAGLAIMDPENVFKGLCERLLKFFGFMPRRKLGFSQLLMHIRPRTFKEKLKFIEKCMEILAEISEYGIIVASRAPSDEELYVEKSSLSYLTHDFKKFKKRISALLGKPGFTPSRKLIKDLRKIESILTLIRPQKIIADQGLFFNHVILSRILKIKIRSSISKAEKGLQVADFIAGIMRFSPFYLKTCMKIIEEKIIMIIPDIRKTLIDYLNKLQNFTKSTF